MKFSFIQIVFADELLSLAFITSNFRYLRMSPERFEHLLTLVGPLISKKATKMRELSSAAERLTLTLRMLASGDDQQSLLPVIAKVGPLLATFRGRHAVQFGWP